MALVKNEVSSLLGRLDAEGKTLAGFLENAELEEIYDDLAIKDSHFFKSRIKVAVKKKEQGQAPTLRVWAFTSQISKAVFPLPLKHGRSFISIPETTFINTSLSIW